MGKRIFIRRDTTPNVMRAKARKQHNREIRRADLSHEAQRLHITVHELLQRKFLECQRIRAASTKENVIRGSGHCREIPKGSIQEDWHMQWAFNL